MNVLPFVCEIEQAYPQTGQTRIMEYYKKIFGSAA